MKAIGLKNYLLMLIYSIVKNARKIPTAGATDMKQALHEQAKSDLFEKIFSSN